MWDLGKVSQPSSIWTASKYKKIINRNSSHYIYVFELVRLRIGVFDLALALVLAPNERS